jgi:uncharacterized membrane protein
MSRLARLGLGDAILTLIAVVGLVVSAVSWDQILNDHVRARAWLVAVVAAAGFVAFLMIRRDHGARSTE